MKDLISVIIPVYNAEKYLNECLDSVIKQTYKKIEIVLINDGSTDKSIEIIEQYKKKDERIVLIDRENKGVLYSRVEGFKNAKGKYITFVDSDDWIEENMIEVLYNNVIKYNADVIKCDFLYSNLNVSSGNLSNINEYKFINKEEFEPDFYNMLFKKMNIHTVWAQMFKKELLNKNIEKVDTTISLGDDLEFNMQLYKNINNILFISDPLYHYRYNSNSITRTFTEKNIKDNIISVTKCYYNAYKTIDDLNIKNDIEYKRAVLSRLLDETTKWQIDLIGTLKNKEKSKEYLKWYYYEYDKMLDVKEQVESIGIDTNLIEYNVFYKKIYSNIEIAYLIGKIIYKLKRIYRNLKRKLLSGKERK